MIPLGEGGAALESESTAPTFERDWFTYRGRDWRIFKRGDGDKAAWYLTFEFHKKRYQQSLGEVNKAAAIETAKIKINAVLDGFKDTLRASMKRDPQAPVEVCTVGQIIKAYEEASLDMDEDTQHRNANCLRLVLRKALETDQVDQLSARVLTEETAQRYFEAAIRQSKGAATQEDAARIKRSANSMFNQGKSLLTPRCLGLYARKQVGLTLPDVSGFNASYEREKFSGKGIKNVHNQPGDAVVRQTLHDWVRMNDRNVFIAVGLALSCGLRKEEIQQVTWGMFKHQQGDALLDGRGWVKDATGTFAVPPIDPFWSVLLSRVEREGWRAGAEDLVIAGNETERTDWTFRRVSDWLASHGWETQKKAHALRAYSGSLVAMKYGIWRASMWLRHASVNTTQGFYTHFLNSRVFKPESVRVRWARFQFKEKGQGARV